MKEVRGQTRGISERKAFPPGEGNSSAKALRQKGASKDVIIAAAG